MESAATPEGAAWITLRIRANAEIMYLGDGSIVIKPHGANPRQGVSRPQLRRELQQVLPTSSTYDAFCMDYFPAVYQMFTAGMDRVERTNLLMAHVEGREILEKLGEHSRMETVFLKHSDGHNSS